MYTFSLFLNGSCDKLYKSLIKSVKVLWIKKQIYNTINQSCINQADRFPAYVVYEIYQKIEDFLRQDIHSEEAFKVCPKNYGCIILFYTNYLKTRFNILNILTITQAIDKNKDGFITKGELKLAKKSVGMEQINDVIKQYDLDKGGLI